MIWLASFPRSGNTFIRNIFYDVFGIPSATFDVINGVLLEKDYNTFPVVKTHLLPENLIPSDPAIKAVYLVRDGRDAMVSIAHHRSDIIAPGSDFIENMKAAIYAEKDSYFGGWSKNVQLWIDRADLVIRYEELIVDPAGCVEKIRLLAGWDAGDYNKIPGFEALKYGLPKYGAGRDHTMNEKEKRVFAQKNFRKGKAGSWKEEMPDELHDLFWSIHGDVMLMMGYDYHGNFKSTPDPDFDWQLALKLKMPPPATRKEPDIRVLIEAEKLVSPVNDGVKRYLMTLLKEFLHMHMNPYGRWRFDLFIHGTCRPITDFAPLLEGRFFDMEKIKVEDVGKLSLPSTLVFQHFLLRIIPESFKEALVKRNILFFHKTFDLTWVLIHKISHWIQIGKRRLGRGMNKLAFLYTGKNLKFSADESDRYDLIHLPLQHHYAPFVGTKVPLITTIHDFTHHLFPQFHTPQNIRNARKGWKFTLKKSTSLIAVSESTLADLERLAGAATPLSVVIHEAIDRSLFHHKINSETRRKVCAKYVIPDVPFLFTLSSIEPRKNLENIIRGFFHLIYSDRSIKLNLVVAGKKTWGTFHPDTLEEFDPERVIFTGFVDDYDLPEIISEALGFCYISYYEGFGLPLLEALNCGTPVIYGNNSSMPEVVGDAGLGADASDYKDISQQMGRLFYHEDFRNEMKNKALKQAALFNSRLMAERTLEIYRKTIQNHKQKYRS